MSVLVKLIGENDGSDEYAAAERLKGIIDSTVPKTVMGEIVLFPSATLFGQSVKDVDIMMIGQLKNYSCTVEFNHDGSYTEDEVFLDSFCTTIEVKSHSISGVRRVGTNLQVLYAQSGWHNVTKQSNDQKVSAMNFFKSCLGESPYITNLIWLEEVNDTELNGLMSDGTNTMLSNVLPSTFDFKEIVKILALQRMPWKYGDKYSIECSFNGRDTDGVTKPLMLFSKARTAIGDLSRKKIEQITHRELGEKEPILDKNVLNIYRGRAGTGKTIDLIRIAIRLVDETGARVQLLTYNRALVSDIRRLFTFADLPDMFEEKCVSVNTMQSFFYGLINGCLYDGKLDGKDYLDRYDELLQELVDFLKSDAEAKEIVKSICEDNPKLNWDYILIDEAQDWSELERDVILLLYDKNKIIVADGGQQFVRSVVPCDWTVVPERNNIKLKYCLRQKRNLVRFVNYYSEILGNDNKILSSDKIVGGRVVIVQNRDVFFNVIKNERNALKKAGNAAYDMLFLVPPSLVEERNGQRHFTMIEEFERKGILLWDGTNEDHRLEFSVDMEESRVLQYESARGLEGWTVCSVDFDEFMRVKEAQYDPDEKCSALFLESAEEKKNKYMLNWALIPLTRAIDTLVISLKDPESIYSRQLLDLAEQHQDYMSVV